MLVCCSVTNQYLKAKEIWPFFLVNSSTSLLRKVNQLFAQAAKCFYCVEYTDISAKSVKSLGIIIINM